MLNPKKRNMLQKTLLCCFLVLFGALAWSQIAPSRIEVFGGYSYTSSNFASSGGGENGWNAGAGLNANKWIGFKADFAQYRYTYFDCCPQDRSTTTTFLFGPQVSIPLPKASRIRPFGEFLIGGAHITENVNGSNVFQQSTSFAWAVGGGLDFRLSNHFWLRGEADYLHTHLVPGDNQLHVADSRARIVTGLVFRF
jgi:Outer membrane protein beta-barrel domain